MPTSMIAVKSGRVRSLINPQLVALIAEATTPDGMRVPGHSVIGMAGMLIPVPGSPDEWAEKLGISVVESKHGENGKAKAGPAVSESGLVVP